MLNHEREVTHKLFKHHATWCPKIPLKKFMKTFSWCLDTGKLKTEQKLIGLPCLHSPPYLFWRKIGAQSHSSKFLNWDDHAMATHFPSGIVERAKRECAWNSPNSRKVRRGWEREKWGTKDKAQALDFIRTLLSQRITLIGCSMAICLNLLITRWSLTLFTKWSKHCQVTVIFSEGRKKQSFMTCMQDCC